MTDKRIQIWHPVRVAGLLIGVLLAGCTASWQAPLETRGQLPPGTYGHAYRPARPPIDAHHYRVRPGDTLYSIAWRANQDVRDLARWNGIGRSYTIYPGQVLRLTPPAVLARPVSRSRPHARPVIGTPAPVARVHSSRSVAQARPRAIARPESTARSAPPPRHERVAMGRHKLQWAWPAQGRVVSGYRAGDPLHKGLKIAGKAGEPVRAAEAGRVVYCGSGLIGYGRLIIVKHNDNYLSAYGHNRRILVHQGQWVAKGQQIAELGRSNGGHPLLYFEIRRNGKPVDPLALLPRR